MNGKARILMQRKSDQSSRHSKNFWSRIVFQILFLSPAIERKLKIKCDYVAVYKKIRYNTTCTRARTHTHMHTIVLNFVIFKQTKNFRICLILLELFVTIHKTCHTIAWNVSIVSIFGLCWFVVNEMLSNDSGLCSVAQPNS